MSTPWEPAGRPSTRPPSTLGSLGRAMAAVQGRVQTVTLVVTAVVVIVVLATLLPVVAVPIGDAVGTPVALLILGLICWAAFVLAVAVVAIVPPLLLSGRDRAAFATHSWIGAREIRRAFGRAALAVGLPTDADSAEAWLARNPDSDRIRFVRVDALIMAGRFDDARIAAERLPDASALAAYRKQEAQALIADQMGAPVDDVALEAGVAAVPPGIDRAEAAASLAVFRARRALPDGDWRAPLLAVRPLIPGSDLRVLVADFGLPVFEILVGKAIVPFTALLAIVVASLTVLPALLG